MDPTCLHSFFIGKESEYVIGDDKISFNLKKNNKECFSCGFVNETWNITEKIPGSMKQLEDEAESIEHIAFALISKCPIGE